MDQHKDESPLGEKWAARMVEHDPAYRDWHDGYSGATDNGTPAPIWLVVPGAIIGGKAVGYLPAASLAEAARAWNWHWPLNNRVTVEQAARSVVADWLDDSGFFATTKHSP